MMRRLGFRCGERRNHGANGCMETIDVGATVAWRGNVDQLRRLEVDLRLLIFANHRSDVFADGFTQAGSGNADHAGLVLRGYVLQTAAKIFSPTEDGAGLAEARGRNIHGLPEMADDVTAHVRRATLRAVQEWQRSLDSAKHQARTQRRAELARIPGRDIAGRRCRFLNDVQTLGHSRIGAHTAVSFRLRDVNCQTGLITVECTSRAKLTMPANPAKASLRS